MMKAARTIVVFGIITGLLAPVVARAGAKDPIDEKTRKEIVDNAKTVHGYGYWWFHGRWKKNGTPNDQVAQCDGPARSCPNCWMAIRNNNTDCIVASNQTSGNCSTNTQCTQANYTCEMTMCVHSNCDLCQVKTTAGSMNCSNNTQCPADYNCVRNMCLHQDCYGADCSGMATKSWELSTEAIDVDDHPYSTRDFYWTRTNKWKRIAWGRVRQGDALVYLGWNAKKRCATNTNCGSCPSGQTCRLLGAENYKCVRNSPQCSTDADCGTNETCIDGYWTGGHIVIVDRVRSLRRKRFDVWHCAGCKVGVPGCKHEVNFQASKSTYVAVRREKVREEPPCSPTDCNGNGYKGGWRNDWGCICYTGYAGTECERCAPGYSGYPDCRPTNSGCTVESQIQCGQEISGTNQGATNSFEDYNNGICTLGWYESGGEKVYVFQPTTPGRAKTLLPYVEDDKDVDVIVLLDNCSEPYCFYWVDYGYESQAGFEYEAGRTYYIVVDSYNSSSEGDYRLKLECDSGSNFIGDPCENDSDCSGYTGGFCLNHNGAKFCSKQCSGSCPDLSGKATTFCVQDPRSASNGVCVSKVDPEKNGCCATIENTSVKLKDRKGNPESEAWVCYPED